jgi:hypothetical protein
MQHLKILVQRQRTTYHPVTEEQALSPHPKGEATKMPKSLGRIFRDWWVELLAVILFILDFSFLVAVLRAYQGEALPDWPLGLSFNTALSALGAVFRAPVLFIAAEGLGQLKWQWLLKNRPLSDFSAYDDATRGPWGSTKLLWTARWRDMLAFLGASLTVASLGIDPFTQAIVSYFPCTTASNSAVSRISRINSFSNNESLGNLLPPWAGQAMDASFNNPASIMPNFSCATGSCAFPKPYHSIGLCTSCIDVTNEIQVECTDNAKPLTGFTPSLTSSGSCNYTLSRNMTGNTLSIPGNNGSYSYVTDYYTENTTANYTSMQVTYADERQREAQFHDWNVFSIRKYTRGDSRSWDLGFDMVSARPLFGCRCQLYFCVRSYTAFVDHSVLHETLQSTTAEWSFDKDETPTLNTVRVDCLEPHVQRYLIDLGYVSVSMEWMAWNGSYLNGTEAQDHISDSPNRTFPVACVYQINPQLEYEEYFTDRVDGTTLRAESEDMGPLKISTSSSWQLADLYNNGTLTVDSLSHAFNNFTSAASNYMRTMNNPAIPRAFSSGIPALLSTPVPHLLLNPVSASPEEWNQPINGQVFMDTTCIHVRWPWLALPAAIFLGTLVFLTMLIVKTTSDHELEVWKSSQNALIWHGLDGTAKFESDTPITKKDMNSRAKMIKVRLEKTRRSWKLVQDE